MKKRKVTFILLSIMIIIVAFISMPDSNLAAKESSNVGITFTERVTTDSSIVSDSSESQVNQGSLKQKKLTHEKQKGLPKLAEKHYSASLLIGLFLCNIILINYLQKKKEGISYEKN